MGLAKLKAESLYTPEDYLAFERTECELSLREIYDRVELTFEAEEFEEN